MSVEQFTVQPSSSLGLIALVAIVGTGLALLVLAIVTGRRAKTIRSTFVALIIISVLIIAGGIWLFFSTNTPSTITVGSGYVNIQSPSIGGAGNLEITSTQIISAYIGQIGSENLTLLKQHGTNYDHFNVGIFTLGNGKTAFVVSSNSTDPIFQSDNGEFVILGHLTLLLLL